MGGFLILIWCVLSCGFAVAHLKATPDGVREPGDYLGALSIFVLSAGLLAVTAAR